MAAPRKVQVRLGDRRLVDPLEVSPQRGDDERTRRHLAALSPAEALFGAMGYRGRVHPGEGRIEGRPASEPLAVPPQESPGAHRLAKPGASRIHGTGIRISEVEGRKFYYDGPLRHGRTARAGEEDRPVHELIDYVPAGCTVTMEVFLESVTQAELGALLIGAGYGEGVGILRFGGYKPAGLGKMRLEQVAGNLHDGSTGAAWKLPDGKAVDPRGAMEAARSSGLVDAAALAELHEITTRLRP